MKKIAAFAAMVVLGASLAFGQATFASASTGRYTVWSDAGAEDANTLASTLDGLFAVYNEYFRFSEAALKAPLTVRKFASKTDFDGYLVKVIGETKDDFVYLHYPTAERSELVIFAKDSADDFAASLAHQAFVQFLKAFIPEPPLWIREGFAVFFERSGADPETGAVSYAENQAWLETVKLLSEQGNLYSIDKLMTLNADAARDGLDVFYPQAWALVDFFINGPDRRYNRFIWDALASLKPEASLDENQSQVLDRFVTWHELDRAESDFQTFLKGRKTFAELVSEGVNAYGNKELDKASSIFAQALAKNPSSYIPHYYMGLIAYAKSDYAAADRYYLKALELGSDEPITYYALGISAFASRRFDEARSYLEQARQGDPERYETKVQEIMLRMESGG